MDNLVFTDHEKFAVLLGHLAFSFFYTCIFAKMNSYLNTLPGPMFSLFISLIFCHFCHDLKKLLKFFSSLIVQMSINIGGHDCIRFSYRNNFWKLNLFLIDLTDLCELIIVKKWKIWSKAFLISPNWIN